jgi:propanol-preferring alcohol dehydrogenase
MRAAVLHSYREPLTVEQRDELQPRDDEVVVEVSGAGLCGTDLRLIDGEGPSLPLPLVLGHEISGHADGVDVVVWACWGCGACAMCRRGDEQLCPDAREAGWAADGGFAEQVLVPSARYLLPLDGVDPVAAAPLADAGATACRAVTRIKDWLEPRDWVAVIGAGGVGQFAIQELRLCTDARVAAVDVAADKRDLALELGAEEAIPPDEPLRPVRAVLDFVGSDESLSLASRSVARGGIVVLLGEAGGGLRFSIADFPYEAHLTSSIWASRSDLATVVDQARRGELTWRCETLPLERINEAVDRLRRGDVLGRLVLTP